jgi:hypothetical protein
MERVIQVFDSFQAAEEADDRYYASLTPQERLDLALEIGKRHREAMGEAGQRFERVCRVVKLSES